MIKVCRPSIEPSLAKEINEFADVRSFIGGHSKWVSNFDRLNQNLAVIIFVRTTHQNFWMRII